MTPLDEQGSQAAGGRLARLLPLAAGVFAGAAVFEVLPGAVMRAGRGVLIWALAGLGLFVVTHVVLDAAGGQGASWCSTLGMWVHSFLEGVVTAVGYGVSFVLGLALTFGLVVHLAPEITALVAVLMRTRLSLRQALVRSAVTCFFVVTGLVVVHFFPLISPPVLGTGMACGSGGLLYLAYVLDGTRGGLGGSLATALGGAALMGLVSLGRLTHLSF